MKNPKEKAEELVERFENIWWEDTYMTEGGNQYFENSINRTGAKQCAIICCEEIIEVLKLQSTEYQKQMKKYYQQVIKEIKNL